MSQLPGILPPGTRYMPRITSLYSPVLERDVSYSSGILRQIQERRQDRLLKTIVPQATGKLGIVQQFVQGTTDPVTQLVYKLGLTTKKPTPVQPQGFGETISHMLGNILGFGTLMMPLLNPVVAAATGAMGTAMAGATPLVATVAGAATKGAIIGATASWLEDRPILPGAATSAALDAVFPLAGAGIKAVANRLGLVRPTPTNPLAALVRKSVQYPATSSEMQQVSRLMNYMPDEMIEGTYKSKLGAIGTLIQPGGAWKDLDLDDLGITDILRSDLAPKKKLTNIMWALRDQPGAPALFGDVLDATGQAGYGQLLKSRGNAKILTVEAMRVMKPVALPEFNPPDLDFRLPKAAKEAIARAGTSKNLSEQLQAADDIAGSIKEAYKNFLRKHGATSLDQLKNDPTVPASTVAAAQRHLIKRNLAQEFLWNIQGQMSQEMGLLKPGDVRSRLLSRAFALTPGATEVNVRWHPKLDQILIEANAKTGKSYADVSGMIADVRQTRELLPFIKQWKAVEGQLKQAKEPLRLGLYSTTIVPLPEDIDKRIAGKAFRGEPAYTALDFVREEIEVGRIVPATLQEEAMLANTRPFSLFQRLIPMRYLFGNTFANAQREATMQRQLFNERFLGAKTGAKSWIESLGLKGKELSEAGKRVGGFLENTNVPQDIFKKIGEYADDSPQFQSFVKQIAEPLGLSTGEVRAAWNIRDALDDIFKIAGLADERYINAYLPHFRRLDSKLIDEIERKLTGAELADVKIRGVKWLNELVRNDRLFEYEEDAFRAFGRYANGAGKKIFYDDLFRTWTNTFGEKGVNINPDRMRLFEQLKESLLGRPSEMERHIDHAVERVTELLGLKLPAGARPTQEVTAFLTELQYLGGIGGNPFAVAKNLTQKILFLPDLDDGGDWTKGIGAWFDYRRVRGTAEGKAIDNLNPLLKNRTYLEGITYGHSAMGDFMERMGLAPETVRDFREKAFRYYQWSDTDNVRDAFGSQFLRLIKKGASVTDAVEAATSTAMSTQFMYGVDSPMLYKTALGKAIGVFMSWPLNWAMMLYEQGTKEDIKKAFTTVGLMSIGAAALSQTGYNFMSTHPVDVARGLLPMALLEGQEEWPVMLRTVYSTTNYLRALAQGDPAAIDSAFEDLKRRIQPMIPLGVTSARIVKFIDTAKNGWKEYDLKGRFRREIPVSEALRNVFGPTMEAQQRYQDYLTVNSMEADYRRLRKLAVDAYMRGDAKRFQMLQQQLLLNYGRGFIEPADIQQEIKLRNMSALERQLVGLPEELRAEFLKARGLPQTPELKQKPKPKFSTSR